MVLLGLERALAGDLGQVVIVLSSVHPSVRCGLIEAVLRTWRSERELCGLKSDWTWSWMGRRKRVGEGKVGDGGGRRRARSGQYVLRDTDDWTILAVQTTILDRCCRGRVWDLRSWG